eukprot:EG_transcript_5220
MATLKSPMKLGQRGLWGFYRFLDTQLEEQFQARMVQWCFWPATLYCWDCIVLNGLNALSYKDLELAHSRLFIWWLIAVDVVAVLLLLAIYCTKPCKRHIIPLVCVFVCLQMVQYAAFPPFQIENWAHDSYSFIVPAGASVFVEGPGGRVDVSARLEDHFAALAAYRATQVAFTNCVVAWVYLITTGLNWWSLSTYICILLCFACGMSRSPYVQHFAIIMNLALALISLLFTVLFAAAIERVLRRNFEAERLLHWELQASQMADSVLNHSLKNTLADVAGNIEMFLANALPTRALEECIVSLRRGARSCKERQVYLQLVVGQYAPVLNAVNLQDFGRQLLAGRPVVGRFPDCTVYADHVLLTLIFDNALSNAVKHGHPQTPDIAFSIEEIPADVCRGLRAGRRRFCFQVTNIAHPDRPELTPQYVQRLFAGCAELQQPTQHRRRSVLPTLSDRIGLTHCVMAAQLAGVTLSLAQEDDVVTFAGMLDAEVSEVPIAVAVADGRQSPSSLPAFPAGLRFVILDDSLAAQRLLKFHIEKWCAPASVVCLGAGAADVSAFMAGAFAADIIVLDQHLDWDDGAYLGSDLVRELRQLRFDGFVCIRSAEDGPSDQALYWRAGANCSLGKDLLGPVMVQQLQLAYDAGAALPTPPPPAGEYSRTSPPATPTPREPGPHDREPRRSQSPVSAATLMSPMRPSQLVR